MSSAMMVSRSYVSRTRLSATSFRSARRFSRSRCVDTDTQHAIEMKKPLTQATTESAESDEKNVTATGEEGEGEEPQRQQENSRRRDRQQSQTYEGGKWECVRVRVSVTAFIMGHPRWTRRSRRPSRTRGLTWSRTAAGAVRTQGCPRSRGSSTTPRPCQTAARTRDRDTTRTVMVRVTQANVHEHRSNDKNTMTARKHCHKDNAKEQTRKQPAHTP
jgi:hypothetical protein